MAAARDEYDGYVGSVARMVREGKSADDIAKRLLEIETDNMAFAATPRTPRRPRASCDAWSPDLIDESAR